MLSLDECEALLNTYREMSRVNYPFVLLHQSCRAASLIEERPMLAQAIFIVTSWKNPARQAALRSIFLRDLSEKYFMRYERSFDLLQSLIVYFGWYVDVYDFPLLGDTHRTVLLGVISIPTVSHRAPTDWPRS